MGHWWGTGMVGAAVVWALVGLGGGPAEGAKWSRAYINALPDEAFAAVEEGPDGARARHLPHHDAQGRVDLAHLRSALSRWHQVRWIDPANATRAREHLLNHFRELRLPAPGERRAPGRERIGSRSGITRPGVSLVAGAVHPHASRPPAPRAHRPPPPRR